MDHIVPTAGVLIFKEAQVLLVQHKDESDHEKEIYWLPAGKIDSNEESIDTAIRELYEETWLITNRQSLVPLPTTYEATFTRNWLVKIFPFEVFYCHQYDWTLSPSDETVPMRINISDLGNYNLLPNVQNIIEDHSPIN